MTDIISSDWTELDANNSSPQPNGVQSGYSPSSIAPIVRAIRGAVKRAYVQSNALVTTTGTGAAYLLTFGATPESYAKGVVIRFYAHADNTGACSLNINSLGPKSILSQHGMALTAGQIKAGQLIEVAYNGTSFQIISNEIHDAKFTGNTSFAALSGNGSGITGLNGSNISTGTVSDARLPTSMAGKTFTTAVTVRNGTDGYLQLQPGDATFTGFAAFHLNDGTRLGTFGYANNSTKQIMLNTDAGATFNFTGAGNDPTVRGNKIWHAGNGGAGSGLAADTTDGYHASEASVVSTLVARNSAGNINGAGIYSSGEVGAGNARFAVDGNIVFDGQMKTTYGNLLSNALDARIKNDGGTYTINITGNAQSLNSQNAAYYTNIPARLGYTPANIAGANFTGNVGVGTTPSGTWINGRSVIALGDSDTGFRQGSDGVIQTFTNNVERMRIDGATAYFMNMSDVQLNGQSLVRNDGGTWTINVTGSANYANSAGSAPANGGTATNANKLLLGGVYSTFNWSGQAGQPGWLWGGNDVANMYVYNPSNFNVNYATTAGNANALGGDGPSSFARIHTGNTTTETNYPLGHIIFVNMINRPDLNSFQTIRISGSTAYTNDSSGTALAGTWRHRGGYTVSGDRFGIFQRVS